MERTDDSRYVVVDGRRWRATDPELPSAVVAELQRHLGRARSAIGRAPDERARAPWRARVQTAKEGLGERGTPWWELPVADRVARAERAVAELSAAGSSP